MKAIYCIGMVIVLSSAVAMAAATTPAIDGGVVKNGRYTATVKVQNRATGTSSLHKLGVMVESDRVVLIDFGDGNSVHAGVQNIGYVYSGGHLAIERDWSTQIITLVSTTVTVVSKDGNTLTFDIRIG